MRHVYVSLDKKVNVVNHIKYKVKLRAKRFVCTVCEIRSPTVQLGRYAGHAGQLGSRLHGKRFRASSSTKLGREQKKNTFATQASQGDFLGFVSSCHEKEADHRDTTIFLTDYRDMKFKLTAHRLDSENRNTVL